MSRDTYGDYSEDCLYNTQKLEIRISVCIISYLKTEIAYKTNK